MFKNFKTDHVQCLGGSPGHCTSQHRPVPTLQMVSFENFVKSMPPSLLELKVIPSFCFAFKIPDDVTASKLYSSRRSKDALSESGLCGLLYQRAVVPTIALHTIPQPVHYYI